MKKLKLAAFYAIILGALPVFGCFRADLSDMPLEKIVQQSLKLGQTLKSAQATGLIQSCATLENGDWCSYRSMNYSNGRTCGY